MNTVSIHNLTFMLLSAVRIDEQGFLVVTYDGEETETMLSAEEVTIRPEEAPEEFLLDAIDGSR